MSDQFRAASPSYGLTTPLFAFNTFGTFSTVGDWHSGCAGQPSFMPMFAPSPADDLPLDQLNQGKTGPA